MHSKKTVLIVDLMNAANMELIRLDFRSSALSRHDKEFRRFCNYCRDKNRSFDSLLSKNSEIISPLKTSPYLIRH